MRGIVKVVAVHVLVKVLTQYPKSMCDARKNEWTNLFAKTRYGASVESLFASRRPMVACKFHVLNLYRAA